MSDFSVVDGRGRGIRAEVDTRHRLQTQAMTIDAAAYTSQVDGTLFMVSSGFVQDYHTITATGGFFGVIRNVHPSLNWVSTTITYYPNASNMFASLYLDVTIGTLANATEITPINMNVGSPNLPASYVRAWVWDEVGDGITGITGGQKAGVTRLYGGPQTINLQSALVIPPGRALALNVKGAGQFSSSLFGYMFASQLR